MGFFISIPLPGPFRMGTTFGGKRTRKPTLRTQVARSQQSLNHLQATIAKRKAEAMTSEERKALKTTAAW